MMKGNIYKLSLILFVFTLAACGSGGSSPAPTPPPDTYSVSGTITAPSNTAMDSDVNDPLASYTENDNSVSAQSIPNPVSLGGFVNLPNHGESGRSKITGDQVDIYQVSLTTGQTVNLEFAEDPVTTDIDLLLFDSMGGLVGSSVGTTSTESVTAPASEIFYIAVIMCGTTIHDSDCYPTGLPTGYYGASNYLLNIGSGANAAMESDFVPGEVIVTFKEQQLLTANNLKSRPSLNERANSLGMQAIAGAPDRAMLMGLGNEQQNKLAFKAMGTSEPTLPKGMHFKDTVAQQKFETKWAIKALRRRSDVASADLNYIRKPTMTPNDEFYSYQWHYPLINLPQAWDITTGSSNVVVAVADTGVFMAHPDLDNNLTADGYDFILSTSISNDGDGIDGDPDDPGDDATPGSSSFHGTHVSGTIAAESNNNQGVAGVSWNTKIMPIRVLGIGGGTTYDIIQGIRYAAGLSNDSGTVPTTAAHIINLSLGGYGYVQAAQDAYTAVRAAGVIVIAAAGNDNVSTPHYPSSYDGVVSVSAVDLNKEQSYYSNYGAYIDVAAPGGDVRFDLNNDGFSDGILSTLADDSSNTRQPNYVFYQGTSMAAPHMAGVVALMKAVKSDLSPTELDNLLISGSITEDLGDPDRDDIFGHGLIDTLKAVQQAGTPNQPQLVINPTSLNFGSTQNALTLDAYDIANPASILVQNVTEDSVDGWISIVAPTTPPGLGTYTVTVDRTGLNDGVYSANITFTTSTADTIIIPVTMRVGTIASVVGDAGFHWVILIDPTTNNTFDDITATFNNGTYSYNFSGVPAGDYLLIAGTDSDNDFVLCDKGEACGGYPLLGQLGILSVVDTDLNNVDFTTGFNFSLGTNQTNKVGTQSGFSRKTGKSIAK